MNIFMKYIPIIATIIVQQMAMIFFMRVVSWDLFLSAGLAAVMAMMIGFAIYFHSEALSGSKNGT